MRMELGDSGELFVWLSEQDAENFGSCLQAKTEQPAVSRHTLRKILQTARQQTGFTVTENLTLEILAVGDGYLLIFTAENNQTDQRPSVAEGPYLYIFSDCDSLLLFADGLRAFSALPYASLYRIEKRFYLVIYGKTAVAPLYRLLRETAQYVGQGEVSAAYIEEYGRACCIGDALARLQKDYRA